MIKIVVASQKGGGAKTTTVSNLAVAAEMAGDGPVAIGDTDPQETLTKWLGFRQAETPRLVTLDLQKNLHQQLAAVGELGFKYCFIDTPPALTKQNLEIMKVADLVVVPTQPSGPDLWTLTDTLGLVREAGVPFVFVLTHAVMNANSTAETIAALSAHGRVLPAIIPHSVKYRTCMTDGRTAIEVFPKSSQAQVIKDLWGHLKKHIRELAKVSENAKAQIGERMHA